MSASRFNRFKPARFKPVKKYRQLSWDFRTSVPWFVCRWAVPRVDVAFGHSKPGTFIKFHRDPCDAMRNVWSGSSCECYAVPPQNGDGGIGSLFYITTLDCHLTVCSFIILTQYTNGHPHTRRSRSGSWQNTVMRFIKHDLLVCNKRNDFWEGLSTRLGYLLV